MDDDFPSDEFVDAIDDMPDGARIDVREGVDGFVDEPAFRTLDDFDRRGETSTITGVIDGDDGGAIHVSGRYFDDGDAYVDDILRQNDDAVRQAFEDHGAGHLYEGDPADAIDRLDELDDPGVASNVRGDIAEDTLLPDLERQKYGVGSYDAGELSEGYIPQDDIPFEMDSERTGFDGLAVNEDGDLVIIETKANSNSGRMVASDLEDTAAGRQLSEDWIQEKFEDWTENPTTEQRQFLETLDNEGHINLGVADGEIIDVQVNHENIATEFVGYQDDTISSEFASATLRKSDTGRPTVDVVEVVKFGNVFPAP